MRILAECKTCHTQYDVTAAVDSRLKPACRRCRMPLVVSMPRAKLAAVVRCAGCGAARGDGGSNCNFCGARLSAADKGWGSMCPGCYCRLPLDANFCVECGLKINPVKLDEERSELQCPRCACALTTRRPENESAVELHECPSCAGTWLDVDTFDAICNDKEKATLSQRVQAAKRNRKNFELTDSETVKYVPCPVCKNLMNRRNFARISGVIIDLCQEHGVWLDNQELAHIVTFIQAGGMEKSKLREVDPSVRYHRIRSRATAAELYGSNSSKFDSLDLLVKTVSMIYDAFSKK